MKMVDSVLCVCSFFYTSFLPIKTDSFIHYFFCEKQHSAALAHLLHPRSLAKPSSLHCSSSYQPFAREVHTRGLTKFLIAYAFAYALNFGHTPTKSN